MIMLKRIACGMIAAAGLLAVRCSAPEDSSPAPETASTAVTTEAESGTESGTPDSTASGGTGTQQRTDAETADTGTKAAAEQSGNGSAQTGTAASGTEKKEQTETDRLQTVKTDESGLIEFPFIEIR
ncbi:MAG: hypothetical protein J6Z45_01995 [Oscillospiraceae bacterium]|nr:hypothetical protein [Oscillospiraceae bacterium]